MTQTSDKRYFGTEMHKIVLGYFLKNFKKEGEVIEAVSANDCKRQIVIGDDQRECNHVYYVFNREVKKDKSEKIAVFAPASDSDSDPLSPVYLEKALTAYQNQMKDQPEEKKCDVLLIPIAETREYLFGLKQKQHWVLAEFRPKENKYRIYDPKNALPFYRGIMSRLVSPYPVKHMRKTCKDALGLEKKPTMLYTGRQRFFSSHRCGPTVVSMIEEKYRPGKQNPLKKAFGRVGRRITAPYRFFTHEGDNIRNRQRGYKDQANEFLATKLVQSAQAT